MNSKKLLLSMLLVAGTMFTANAQWSGGGTPGVDIWRPGTVAIGMTGPAGGGYILDLDNGDFNIAGAYGLKFDGTYGLRLVSPSGSDFLLGDGGNIGIGLNPSFKLDVDGDINMNTGALWFAGTQAMQLSGSDFILGSSGGNNFGIGIAPSYKFDVDGDVNLNSGVLRFAGTEVIQRSGSDFIIAGTGGNVGIGGSPGSWPLQVNGAINSVGGYVIGGTPVLVSTGGGNFQLPSGNIGIGTSSPSYKLDVNGDVNIPGANAFRIGGDQMLATYSDQSMFIGKDAGAANGTAVENLFVGHYAGEQTTAPFNVFVGTKAGENNVGGTSNVFVGAFAGRSNVSGIRNVSIGETAGADGNDNVFIGFQSGRDNQTNSNVGIGIQALFHNETGYENVAIGAGAGFGSPSTPGTGIGNVFMGYNAGNSNVSGSNSIYIGKFSGQANTADDNNTYVGYNAAGNGQRNTYVGSDVAGDGYENILLGYRATATGTINNSGAIGSFADVQSNNTIVIGDANAATVMGANARTGALYRLEVTGDAFLSTGTLWTTSDQKFKTDIKDYTHALDVINKLHPVSYKYRNDLFIPGAKDQQGNPVKRMVPQEEQIGFIAQEIEKVIPEMVRTHEDGSKAVNYSNMYGLLTQALKEEDAKVEQQEATIDELKNEVTAVKAENEKLLVLVNELASRMEALEQHSDQPGTVTGSTTTEKARLEQNSPNPFTENTVVKYFLPENGGKATIVIRSEQGREVLKFDLNHTGHGNIIVSANSLTAGLFTCELYIGDRITDVKKMVLVK